MRSSTGRGETRLGAPGRTTPRAVMTCAALLVVLAGCCGPVPLAETYFDREDPLGALKGFVYAVEAGQWDYAYESLTEATRDEIGHVILFRGAIGILNDPIGDVSIYELITNVYKWAPVSQGRNRALVRIVSRGRREDGRLLVRVLDVHLSREDEEWRMDLLATAEGLAGRRMARVSHHRAPWGSIRGESLPTQRDCLPSEGNSVESLGVVHQRDVATARSGSTGPVFTRTRVQLFPEID